MKLIVKSKYKGKMFRNFYNKLPLDSKHISVCATPKKAWVPMAFEHLTPKKLNK